MKNSDFALPVETTVTPTGPRRRLPAGPCSRCGGRGRINDRTCRPCHGTGCRREIVVPLQVISMADVTDEDVGYERLAILHAVVRGTNVLVSGQTDTGIRVSLELPLRLVRSAPTILFTEREG